MQTVEQGRFQVWEYLVNHSQLLLRRPGTAELPENVDLIFTGVRFISLPTIIDDPSVREGDPEDRRNVSELSGTSVLPDELHIVEGLNGRGFVVASSARREANVLDLFETSLERWADTRASAERLELEVLFALARFGPTLGPQITSHAGRTSHLDALINADDRSIGIEVKWVSPTAAQTSIRRTVIDSVERLDAWADELDGLVVVVGSPDDNSIRELEAYLSTAFGSRMAVTVVGWTQGDGPEKLDRAVSKMISR